MIGSIFFLLINILGGINCDEITKLEIIYVPCLGNYEIVINSENIKEVGGVKVIVITDEDDLKYFEKILKSVKKTNINEERIFDARICINIFYRKTQTSILMDINKNIMIDSVRFDSSSSLNEFIFSRVNTKCL